MKATKNGSGTTNRIADVVKETAPAPTAPTARGVTIAAPKIETAEFRIIGNAPYVQNKFSAKAGAAMRAKQAEGDSAKNKRKREAKDFDALYLESRHVSADGWFGIPASAFRAALISACRMVKFPMTLAKLSIFVVADGYDADTPLVRITKGDPSKVEHFVRNDSGVSDIRVRSMWSPGWEAVVRIRYSADQFRLEDVTALMHRVGMFVGVGEGRPDSKDSAGMGWGTFDLA